MNEELAQVGSMKDPKCKIDRVIAGTIALDFTVRDYVTLALAAAYQAGVSARQVTQIEALLKGSS